MISILRSSITASSTPNCRWRARYDNRRWRRSSAIASVRSSSNVMPIVPWPVGGRVPGAVGGGGQLQQTVTGGRLTMAAGAKAVKRRESNFVLGQPDLKAQGFESGI